MTAINDNAVRGVCEEGVDSCMGSSACLHAIYRTLSCSAMRAGVEFSFENRRGAAAARTKVLQALAAKWTYAQLATGGMTPELLAYAGITLKTLLARHDTRKLETIIQSLNLSFDDLLLLGFKFTDFANVSAYPLIVLYDLCGLRALHLLSFHVRFIDFKKFIFDTDARYAKLLDLNVTWLKRVLCGTSTKT